jgi:C4-dicarboxylate-specific signal transduction histidine kinase
MQVQIIQLLPLRPMWQFVEVLRPTRAPVHVHRMGETRRAAMLDQAVHLAQAFLNVMENAIFAVQGRTERWIEIQVENLPETIAISVTDSGKGISTEHRGEIMDPFFTTKEVGHGRGLGLSISKGIVDAHRGRLFLDESSQCTRFTFILPKVQRKSAAA